MTREGSYRREIAALAGLCPELAPPCAVTDPIEIGTDDERIPRTCGAGWREQYRCGRAELGTRAARIHSIDDGSLHTARASAGRMTKMALGDTSPADKRTRFRVHLCISPSVIRRRAAFGQLIY